MIRQIRFGSYSLCALSSLLLLTAPSVNAIDLYWDNDSGSLFPFYTDASFWSTDAALTMPAGAAPLAGDNIFFLFNTSPYSVILSVGNTATDVTASNGDVTFTGPSGTLDNSGVVTIDDAIAAGLADGAKVTLNGPTWTSTGNATVGATGFGTFTVNNSGIFTSPNLFVGNDLGATGEVNVDGTGSTITAEAEGAGTAIFVGNAGTGTLNVTDGGLVETTNDISGVANIELGVSATGDGTLNITGPSSLVRGESIIVGRNGSGQLNITAGGVLNHNVSTSRTATIALESGSGDAVVNGDGSQWIAGRIVVGNLGDGTLSIESGGSASTTFDTVLGSAGGSGRVAVFGSGTNNSTLDIDRDLFVGNVGLGELFVGQDLSGIADGDGTLEVARDLNIGAAAGNNLDNKVIISGANTTADIGRNLTVGDAGKGTFEARNGATVTITTNLEVGLLGDSNGTVVLDGASTTLVAARLFNGNGTGNGSTGVMTVSGGAVATFTGTNDSAVGALQLGDDDEGDGTLTVTGAGSLVETTNAAGGWFIGGSPNEDGGTGTANILDGGKGYSENNTILAYRPGSAGNLTIDGDGSLFEVDGQLQLGRQGLGNVDVTDSGRLDVTSMLIADASGSNGSQLDIAGAGSVVDIDGLLHVGDTNRGTLNVTNGGQLNVSLNGAGDRLLIADEGSSDGSKMKIEGAGSRVDYFGTDRVSVGFDGGSVANPAELEVLAGGVLQAVQRNPDQTIASQAQLVVADQSGSNGKLTIDGEGSRVEARLLDVGEDGLSNGTVNITGGGLLEVLEFAEIGAGGSGTSTMTVSGMTGSGVGSRFDVPGDLSMGAASGGTASGTLNISDGGDVDTGDQGFVGRFSGNTGVANVGGAGALATWDVETDLIIAGAGAAFTDGNSLTSGAGTLNVMANGQVTANNTIVLKDRGVINLTGGELAADDFLFQDSPNRSLSPTVNFTSGTLRYTADKTLDADDFNVIFDGGSYVLTAGQHMAIDGVAELDVPLRLNGGELSVGEITSANASQLDFDAGTFNLTNSSLTVDAGGQFGATIVIEGDEAINVVDNGATVGAAGSLNIIEGGFSSADTTNDGLIIVSNTTSVDYDSDDTDSGLTNNGTLLAVDSTIAGAVENNGDIEIVGTVDFVDGVSLTDGGALGIDLNGLSNFDAISVGGDAALGGALNVEVVGFSLAAGYSFEILDITGTQSGTFAGLSNGALVGNFGGVDLFIDYAGGDGNDVVLFVAAAGLAGDFNGDGMVNTADYTVWRDNLGGSFDLNGNGDESGGSAGVVDTADYALWKSNFGATAAAASAQVANVPEPAGLVLLGIAYLAALGASRHT